MNKIQLSITIFTSIILLLPTQSLAQGGMRGRGGGGWGPGNHYSKMYNPQTIETLSGEVVSINKMMPMRGMSHGVHLQLKTAKETVSVHLGPEWYIENQDIQIQPKDKIEVRGSRVTFGGKPAIIAASVKKGDKVLTLRDDKGFPVWSGWH
ncbi:MAG: DNA-binding protein [Scytonema sp. RU_4_4]|nr:DNA-binding protein [Scytonema sp. RU_4_4]NJR75246.1 DNA-binding protein [Scytonema sp. CRU_2_7]